MTEITVRETLALTGTVDAEVRVVAGGNLVLLGRVTRDVVVEKGGWAAIRGTVDGRLVRRGGEVTVYVHGIVRGGLVEADVAPETGSGHA